MTAVAQLHHLRKMFPNAKELAVSTRLLNLYLWEMVQLERAGVHTGEWMVTRGPWESLPGSLRIQHTGVWFKGLELIRVWKDYRNAYTTGTTSGTRRAPSTL